ncbi:MAG: aminoacyl-histidine dipeptidase [bacterium]
MNLRSDRVLELFERINRIPRCSGNEQQIARWLVEWADSNGFPAEQDEARNVLIRVPASEGLEHAPTVVLQGHMDMVCEKTPDSSHNFETDPIPLVYDGEWLHAQDTTLGADNGIAIALALAVAASDAAHPPLEILVTVDEETGLTGASNLREGWLSGTKLLNLDSEDEGIFTVGCAGGRDSIFTLRLDRDPVPDGLEVRELAVGGLQGGHSGVDIHLGRANANVLLVRALRAIRDAAGAAGGRGATAGGGGPRVRLASLHGGSAHNAIPRDAAAVIAFEPADRQLVEETVAATQAILATEFTALEPSLQLALRSAPKPSDLIAEPSARALLDFLAAMPHGVLRMSADVPGLVETSTNFATIRMKNDTVEVKTSQRSSYRSRLDEVVGRLESLARLAGATVRNESSYPPWEPHMESELLGRAVESYENAFGSEPTVEVIHAGLECGVIGAKYPGMEMVSFGPTVQNAHSPDERLHLPSLEKTCTFVEALLSSYRES